MTYEDGDDGVSPVPEAISEYRFVDENDDPVCFSSLPLKWSDEDEIVDESVEEVFLHGEFDDGLQKIYKRVIAWKVEFVGGDVDLWVLSKDGNWFKIFKPRIAYQESFRRIFVSLECLSYLKMNPSSKESRLWDHLRRKFSHFEVSPRKDDFMFHQPFIQCIVKRDEALSKAEVFPKLGGRAFKRNSSLMNAAEDSSTDEKQDEKNTQKGNGVVMNDADDDDDGDDDDGDDDDESELDHDDGYDHVCVICDNGGDLLCCEGECLRSFHATKGSGADSQCKTLGYTRAQVKAIKNFFCPNCLLKKHQCFACGQLGNSDKESGPEVFRCMSATCGHFYHPSCMAKLLNLENEIEAAALEEKIVAGGSFMCPVHRCTVCNGLEDKKVEELQFAICRRCPKTYHRKCLPSKIALEDSDDEDGEQRAWDDLIPNRILIYCLKHKIDRNIGTPKRNHIVFPETVEEKTVMSADLRKKKAQAKRKAEVSPAEKGKPNKISWPTKERDKLSKTQQPTSSLRKIIKDSTEKHLAKDEDLLEPTINANKLGDETSDVVPSEEKKKLNRQVSLMNEDTEKRKKQKVDSSRPAPEITRKAEIPVIETAKKRPKNLMKTQLNSETSDDTTSIKSPRPSKAPGDWMEISRESVAFSAKEPDPPISLIDDEARKRISFFVRNSPLSSFKDKDLLMKKRFSAGNHYHMNSTVSTIPQGKVEGYVRAIRAAVQIFKNGGSIDDIKAVCGPDTVNQMIIWKERLRSYLGPFLRGVRGSSYGLDAKEMSKTEGIVERLHWYVENDDTIVDVCCGAKNFNNLMSKKLELTGKKCSFKSFDIFASKNDANFQKRDWMAVHPKELQLRSQAVIRLVLPGGVNAAHARRLISKVVACKPKLLFLNSPKSIERLGAQPEAYDLIWEDEQKPAGPAQSPRSPAKPFSLYLWSRPDWTAKHREIAMKHGHNSHEPTKQNIEDEDWSGHTDIEEREIYSEAEEHKKTMEYTDGRESSDREQREQRPKDRFLSSETYEKAKTSPRSLDTSLPADYHHHHQAGDEGSPKPSQSSGVTQMKYHWSCLYGLDDHPEPIKSSGLSEPSSQPVAPQPISRDPSPGERKGIRYQWADPYGQDERETSRSSEIGPHLLPNHQPTVYPGPSDRRPWISPSFPDQPNENTVRIYDGHMMDSPRERESQTWVSPSERPIMGSSYVSPTYGFNGGLPAGPGYHAGNFGPTHWVDPAVDQARVMYERRMWEMPEQASSPRALHRSGSRPLGGRRRGMFDANHHPYL
ncbi:protein ENHANCED DOWNY MILDEW 2-like isoform X2 [Wolffia australiana]